MEFKKFLRILRHTEDEEYDVLKLWAPAENHLYCDLYN